MLESNAFIMMSCIENHSSTLREAMYLGVPCISSAISSVPEFVTHGKNGFCTGIVTMRLLHTTLRRYYVIIL